jgi:5-methylcytosine-specific restriction endonuclease McrA
MGPTSEEKQVLVDSIADILAISRDELGPGSKEHRPFLRDVATALGVAIFSSDTKHSIARKIITYLGGSWGPEYYSTGGTIQANTFKFIYDRLLIIYGRDRAAFMESVERAIATMDLTKPPPAGNRSPTRRDGVNSDFNRCPNVVAWVLLKANGKCECCEADAPFHKPNGVPYLEVHHVQTLATGGPDTVQNAVALCPNCHRAVHFARKRRELQRTLEARLKDRGYGSPVLR